ncbi:hypothetical protein [Pseudoduganella rhizocola]|uniref:hypothetical protein n=1 Tax=Pseudoduganella rhizocola TaxID=3382643 RepID=UPI0038B64168
MSAWQAILIQPWQEQRQRSQLWFTALLAAIVAGAPAAVLLFTRNWRATSMVAASVALCIVFVWWGLFVRSAVLQSHPANAVLVPRLRLRLLRLTCLLWIVVSLLAAAVGSLLLGHFGLLLCGFAAFLLYVIAVQRFHALAYLPLALIILNSLASGSIFEAAGWLAGALGAAGLVAAGLALNAVLSALLLPQLFPAGGDRHHAWHARLLRSAARLNEGSLTPGQEGRVGRKLLALLNRPYWRRFEQDVQMRREVASQEAMLLHALGPRAQLGSVLTCVLVLGLVFLSTGRNPLGSKAYEFVNIFVVPFALLPALLFPVQQRLTLQRTAGEQGLLRLSPGAPAAPDFNRVLGIALAKYFVFTWLLSIVVIAGAAMLATRSLWIPHAMPAITMLGFAAGAFVLRDYASLPRLHNGGNALLLPMVGAGAAAVAAAALGPHLPWMWITLAGLPLLAWLWWSRWQNMLAARPAFPAARG